MWHSEIVLMPFAKFQSTHAESMQASVQSTSAELQCNVLKPPGLCDSALRPWAVWIQLTNLQWCTPVQVP